jgi:hypothetical protein
MKNNNLPTDDLKKYGIVDENNSFSKKLSENDIQKFLQGYTIVVDNDKNISKIIENSKDKIEYSNIQELSKLANQMNFEKKAFVFDKETNKIVEFDLIKNSTELTAIIADKKDEKEINRYKIELLKLKGFLKYFRLYQFL